MTIKPIFIFSSDVSTFILFQPMTKSNELLSQCASGIGGGEEDKRETN